MKNYTLLFSLLISFSLPGFAQVFNHPTGNQTFSAVTGGTYYDNGGSGANYATNMNSMATFTSPSNGTSSEKFKFNFTQFVTEPGFDSLSYYDGLTTAAPFIGKQSGTQTSFDVYSTRGEITFNFKSDGATVGAGWTAAISTLRIDYTTGPASVYRGTTISLMGFTGTNTTFAGGAIVKLVGPEILTAPTPTITNGTSMSVASFNIPCSTTPGTYDIEISGFGQGKFIIPAAITINALSTSISSTNVTCNGSSNGSATLTPSGGNGACTYSWSPSVGTTSTVGGLGPGTYTGTAIDGTGCTSSSAVVITEPAVLLASSTPSTVTICAGSSASLSASATGGTGGYSYSWSPASGLSNTTIANPTATPGSTTNYTVTVTDANTCTAIKASTVTVNPLPTVVVTPSSLTICLGGVASLSASGATSYSWSPATGLSTTTGAGVSATPTSSITYTVTGTNGSGCTNTATSMVTVNALPVATFTSSANQCLSGNSFSFTNTGTTGGGATYSWNFGSGSSPATSTVNNPAGVTYSTAGTYTVTHIVTNLGCTNSATNNIIVYPMPTADAGTDVTFCSGGSIAIGSGSVGGNTYAWSPTTGLSSSTVSNPTITLTNGTASPVITNYTVTVTNANACSVTDIVAVTVNPLPTASVNTTNSSCGMANGNATVTVGGGTPAYTYAWTSGGTGTTESGLSAGSYTVTVTDANGCTTSSVANISDVSGPTASITSSTEVSCFGGGDGSATVAAAGGTPGYTYLWSPAGGTSATATGLSAGTYSVTVTDALGCVASASVTMTEPSTLLATIMGSTNVSCFGGSDGAITMTPSGGTSPYTFVWSPSGGTSATAAGLSAGNYTCTVTDAKGCTATASAAITEPTQLTASTSPASFTICSGGSVSLNASVTGGAGGYTYLWSPSTGLSSSVIANPDATPAASTNYSITVTDANGCVSSGVSVITVDALEDASYNYSSSSFCLTGTNPFPAMIITSGGTFSATGTITINSTTGEIDLATSSAGTYNVTYTTNGTCPGTSSSVINITNGFDASFTINSQACQGSGSLLPVFTTGTAGAFSAIPAGLTFVDTFSGEIDLNGSTPGTYQITNSISPSGGCAAASATQTLTINPVQTVSNLQTVCFGGSYTINGNTYTNTGNYNDTLSTVNGCDSIVTTNLTVLPENTFNQTFSLCSGQSVTVGSNTYNTTGVYTDVFTAVNGCDSIVTTNLTVASPSVVLSATAENCNNADGTVNASVTGGIAPYVYSWSNGQITQSISNLTSAIYSVSVTDANGCMATASDSVYRSGMVTLSGLVLVQSNPTSSGQVVLYQVIDTTAYIPVAVAQIDTAGNYFFPELRTDKNYIVAAKPDTSVNPTAVLTFHNGAYRWDSATVIVPVCAQSLSVNINLILLAPPAGSGIISGQIIDASDSSNSRRPGEPVIGVDVSVEQIPGGSQVMRTTTDSNGVYKFENVPDGDYQIFVNVPGCAMISTYEVNISGADSISEQLFYVDSLHATIDTITSLPEILCNYTVAISGTGGCLGSAIAFSDISNNVNPVKAGYLWDFETDGIVNDTTKGDNSFVYSASGLYTVSLIINTYDGICSDTAQVQVQVNDIPQVSLNLALDTLCLNGGLVALSGESPSGGVYSGYGVIGAMYDPAISGISTDTVYYTYTDNNGCYATANDVFVIDACLGINNPAKKKSIEMYPNPSGNIVFINTKNINENVKIEVRDMKGSLVYSSETNRLNGSIDVSGLAPSVYSVRFSGSDFSDVQKLIVK